MFSQEPLGALLLPNNEPTRIIFCQIKFHHPIFVFAFQYSCHRGSYIHTVKKAVLVTISSIGE